MHSTHGIDPFDPLMDGRCYKPSSHVDDSFLRWPAIGQLDRLSPR